MPALLVDPIAEELLKERRRRSGIDRFDEVWEGVLHMVAAPSGEHATLASQLHGLLRPLAAEAGLVMSDQFNLGADENDYRVPDAGLHRTSPKGVWHLTATLVIEIVSPGDETWQKLPFYAAHEVDEVLILDPRERAVHWLSLTGGEYRAVQRSALVELGPAELAGLIEWP